MTAARAHFRRSDDSHVVGVVAPPESRRAGIWDRPVPGNGRAPLVWLLSAHGGSGVSTLAHVLAPAADCERRWPAVLGSESPFVVVVARETIGGLTRAHDLLRQHSVGLAGPCVVIGLVTVAARAGRVPSAIRRYRDVVGSLAPQVWKVNWHEEWTLVEPEKLPVWTPGAETPSRGRHLDAWEENPPDIHRLGEGIVGAVRSATRGSVRSSTGAHEFSPTTMEPRMARKRKGQS